jgi:hypothetical protein
MTTQTEKNSHSHQTSMPWVRFEPTITASEREKRLHALDRSAGVTGVSDYMVRNFRVNLYLYVDTRQRNLPHWITRRHKPQSQAPNNTAVLCAVIVWIKLLLYLWQTSVAASNKTKHFVLYLSGTIVRYVCGSLPKQNKNILKLSTFGLNSIILWGKV